MELLKYILISIPMISSMTCGIILIVVFYKNLSVTEAPVLRTLGGYYFSLIALWLIDNLTLNLDKGRLILLPILFVLITLSQVCFYHFICYLIPTKKKFNFFQYKMIFVLFAMSSSLVYVLYETTEYKQLDFTSFCSIYLTIYVRINIIIYTFLCVVQLFTYQKEKTKRKINIKRLNWIHLLLSVKTLFTLLFCFNTQHIVVEFLLVFTLSLQHIILTFNMLQDKNRVKIPIEYKTNVMLSSGQIVSVDQTGTMTVDGIESIMIPTSSKSDNLLTQQELVTYFTDDKPYVNKDFKLDTLVTHFGVNRSYVSKFINVTYHCNVSQFINRWRLKEVEFLQEIHKNMDINDLVVKAGFSDYRHYLRAVQSAKKQ